jgi:hypothetical protein
MLRTVCPAMEVEVPRRREERGGGRRGGEAVTQRQFVLCVLCMPRFVMTTAVVHVLPFVVSDEAEGGPWQVRGMLV